MESNGPASCSQWLQEMDPGRSEIQTCTQGRFLTRVSEWWPRSALCKILLIPSVHDEHQFDVHCQDSQ